MNWDDLKYFLAIVDHSTVSAAAAALDVNHTTVSRRIDALETALGVKLFQRLPQAWQLSDEGLQLVERARGAADAILAVKQTADASNAAGGSVSISAPPALLRHFLTPRLMSAQSDIHFELIADQQQARLTQGEADLALRMVRPSEQSLAARLLARIGYGLYGSAAYLARTAPEAWRFISYHEPLAHLPHQEWLEQVRGERALALRTNDLDVMLAAADAGAGLAVLPHYLARRSGSLRVLEDHVCPHVGQLWLVVHVDVRRTPRVRRAADMVADLFVQPACELEQSLLA